MMFVNIGREPRDMATFAPSTQDKGSEEKKDREDLASASS